MYNPKDIQFVGKHDYKQENPYASGVTNQNFSVGIFKWEMKNNGKAMKKSKTVVRVIGPCSKAETVFAIAETVVLDLDANKWDGRKTVRVK